MKRVILLLAVLLSFTFSCDNGGSDPTFDQADAISSIRNVASSYSQLTDNGGTISISFAQTNDDKTIMSITFSNYNFTDSIYGEIRINGSMEVTYWQVNSEGSSFMYVDYSATMNYTGTPFSTVTMDYSTSMEVTGAGAETSGTITIDGATYNL